MLSTLRAKVRRALPGLRFPRRFGAWPVPRSVAPASARVDSAALEDIEKTMLSLPQVECPVTHRFGPGVYLRSVVMPAGSAILGHEHRTSCFNVMLRGRVRVLLAEGQVSELVAPCVFLSPAGERKLAHVIEETEWLNTFPNPTNETDIEKLEAVLIRKSSVSQLHAAQLARLAAEVSP